MSPLSASIEALAGQSDAAHFQVRLRIENRTGTTVRLLNPKMGRPSPEMNWRYSNEAYQISLLMMFNHLSMWVTDEAGDKLPLQMIDSGATPALWPPLEFAPGDSMTLTVPIGEFFVLQSGRTYDVTIEYGEQGQKVKARGRLAVPLSAQCLAG